MTRAYVIPDLTLSILAGLFLFLPSTADAVWPTIRGESVRVADGSGTEALEDYAADGFGGMLVVWVDERDLEESQRDIYAQRIDANGTEMWAPDGVSMCNQFAHQEQPRIISDGVGGVIAVWQDARTGETRLWGDRLDGFGLPQWSASNGMDISGQTFTPYNWSVITNGASGAHVIWRGESWSVSNQIIAGNGATLFGFGGSQLFSFLHWENEFKVCSDAFGGFWLTYNELFGDNGGLRYDANGQFLADNTQYEPLHDEWKLSPDGLGGFIAVELSITTGTVYSRVDEGGNLVVNYQTIPSGEYQTLDLFDVVGDGAGGGIVLTRFSGPMAIKLDPEGNFPWNGGFGVQVGNHINSIYFPKAVATGENGAIVVRRDFEGIYYSAENVKGPDSAYLKHVHLYKPIKKLAPTALPKQQLPFT